jgi:hypothetical protein
MARQPKTRTPKARVDKSICPTCKYPRVLSVVMGKVRWTCLCKDN